MHPWFDNPEGKVRYVQVEKPYGRVLIGSDPRDGMPWELASKIHAFINVSDSPGTLSYIDHVSLPEGYNPAHHWYPVSELGYWGLGVFYWAAKLFEHYLYNQHHTTVYVHCHAGAHRSPLITALCLFAYRRYATLEEACAAVGRPLLIDTFFNDIKWGCISPYTIRMLRLMRQDTIVSRYALSGVYAELCTNHDVPRHKLFRNRMSMRPQQEEEATELNRQELLEALRYLSRDLPESDMRHSVDWNEKEEFLPSPLFD